MERRSGRQVGKLHGVKASGGIHAFICWFTAIRLQAESVEHQKTTASAGINFENNVPL